MRLCTIAGSQRTQTLSRKFSDAYADREDYNKDAFCDEPNTLIPKIPSQKTIIVGVDGIAKTGLEQQFDALGKWFFPMEQTWNNGNLFKDSREQRVHIIASTFKRNRRRHQLTWHGTTPLMPEEQRKRKPTLKL
ncbi:hypothetical protein RB195_000975 [Necator americanus]|uniref:Deoxynucleoside kinase domain-containing protein n=1 Tax=Necator americanus TaxID=51031 RepID=A0ABR1DC51_NECAM